MFHCGYRVHDSISYYYYKALAPIDHSDVSDADKTVHSENMDRMKKGILIYSWFRDVLFNPRQLNVILYSQKRAINRLGVDSAIIF
jgi:hypothetical protein